MSVGVIITNTTPDTKRAANSPFRLNQKRIARATGAVANKTATVWVSDSQLSLLAFGEISGHHHVGGLDVAAYEIAKANKRRNATVATLMAAKKIRALT